MLLLMCGTVFRRIRTGIGSSLRLCSLMDTRIMKYERIERKLDFLRLI